MTRLNAFYRIAFLVFTCGCTSPQSTTSGPASAVDASVTPPDLLHRVYDFSHDLTPPPSVSVHGFAVDEMGVPIPDAFMSVCNPSGCHSVNANNVGAFVIDGVQVVRFGVRSHDDSTVNPVRGTVVTLFNPTIAGTSLDAGNLYVPSMGAGAKVGPAGPAQTLAPGDGLGITVSRQDLDFPIGEELGTIASRRIPLAHVPAYDLGAEELLAVYAFLPYSTTSKSPVGVTAPIALPPGTEVHFRAVHEFDGLVTAPVKGHAAMDGKSVSTDPGAGIDTLTWVLISK